MKIYTENEIKASEEIQRLIDESPFNRLAIETALKIPKSTLGKKDRAIPPKYHEVILGFLNRNKLENREVLKVGSIKLSVFAEDYIVQNVQSNDLSVVSSTELEETLKGLLKL